MKDFFKNGCYPQLEYDYFFDNIFIFNKLFYNNRLVFLISVSHLLVVFWHFCSLFISNSELAKHFKILFWVKLFASELFRLTLYNKLLILIGEVSRSDFDDILQHFVYILLIVIGEVSRPDLDDDDRLVRQGRVAVAVGGRVWVELVAHQFRSSDHSVLNINFNLNNFFHVSSIYPT